MDAISDVVSNIRKWTVRGFLQVCAGVWTGDRCADACPASHYTVAETAFPPVAVRGRCQPCHAQCDQAAGCTGPLASDCTQCLYAAFQGVVIEASDDASAAASACVPECPHGTFRSAGRVCEWCAAECAGGCSGPGNDECSHDLPAVDGGGSGDDAGCGNFDIVIYRQLRACLAAP